MSARKKRRTSPPSGQFDLVVVGCGGGHDETNLSGYLCKPRDQSWDAGILGLEAGSGYGALKRLLGTTHPRLFSSLFLPKSKPSLSAADRAHIVYTHLRAFLLTHAHLDHAASLVISAGSLPGPTKYVLGAQGVLDDLNRCIFTPGRCWPNIVGWDGNTTGGKLKALPVAPSNGIGDKDEEYTDLGVGIESVQVRLVPLAHGSCSGGSQPHPDDTHHANEHQRHQQGEEGVYRSSAFFVRHKPSRHEFLFFGDVEADNLTPPLPSPHSTPALTPASTLDSLPACEPTTRPLLFPVWQHAAHLFTTSRLHTLLLECSWPAGRPTAQLFGHLGVEQVRREMRTLAGEVLRARKATTDNVGAGTVGIMTESMDEVLNPIAIKPPANRVSTRPRSRRTQTENLPRITRGSKRKATHLSLNTIPVSRGTTPLSDTNANLDPLAGALTGLRVIIIHCKEPAPGFDLAGAPTIADYIVRQLRQGVPGEDGLSPDELGVEYVAAHQGDEFGELCFSLSLIRSDAGWDRTSICVDHGRRGAAHSARGQDADWKLLPPAFLVL